MKKAILIFSILTLTSCDWVKEKKLANQETTPIQKTNTPTQEIHNKDKELYYEFILNLEKTLWLSDLFVKTNYNGKGWQLLDKNGKYIIRSEDNFTKYRDTSISYALTIIKMDNYQTNKNGVDRTISIPYRFSSGRTSTIDLDFSHDNKSKITDGMMYSEVTHYFPFKYGIIVDYRACFNNERVFLWRNDSIIQSDYDCKEEDGYIKKLLGKR